MVKSKNFIIPLVIYPLDVMVSLGETDNQLKDSLSKTETEWDDNMTITGTGRFVMNDDWTSIIRTKVYPITTEHYGILQHEIFHAVMVMLDRVGMKFVILKSDEAYAYLIQYLTTKIYEQL